MEQIIETYINKKQFMGSVLVAQRDKVVFSKGYGLANLEWGISNTPTTKFRIGSITKQFTAASVLLLEQRGQLSLTEPITNYLAVTPSVWKTVTIYQLLTHTGGIADLTRVANYVTLERFPATTHKLLCLLSEMPLEFEPGTRMRYSNSGYILLGAIIEAISGLSYENFLTQNIFLPLDMKDTGYDTHTPIVKCRAAGYVIGAHGFLNSNFIDMSVPHSAGALYSTTEDLYRWQRALFQEGMLATNSLRKMITPFMDEYACGVAVESYHGRRVIQHFGNIEGFSSALAYYPDTETSIIVLANTIGSSAVPEIVGKLGIVAHGQLEENREPRNEIILPSDILRQYVGSYRLSLDVSVMVTLDQGRLYFQLSGQMKDELFAESESFFFSRSRDAQVEFIRNTNGSVGYLVLRCVGRDKRAIRISDLVKERVACSISADRLLRFIGAYELRPGLDLEVMVEDEQITIKVAGQEKISLFAESDCCFFARQIDLQIIFECNALGDICGLVLHQGPLVFKARKNSATSNLSK